MTETEPSHQSPNQTRSVAALIIQFLKSSLVFWIPAIIFLAIANRIIEKMAVPGDVTELQSIHHLSTPVLNRVFIIITTLGSPSIVIVGVLVAAAALWYLRHRRDALFLVFAAGGTAVINTISKLIFTRKRPDLWPHLVIEKGFSFPSGHAMISMSLALTVMILLWRTKYRWFAVVLGSSYALLVSFSRLYLGVHFPSDIIGGWCISALWIVTLHHVFQHYTRENESNSA